jgi:AbrB family looped-hinge helix DNA binding protein
MSKVGPKGQVVIKKEIRDRLGIEPGSLAIQRIVDGKVEITFIPPTTESQMGVLKKYTTSERLAEMRDVDWGEVREQAWERHVRERYSNEEDYLIDLRKIDLSDER